MAEDFLRWIAVALSVAAISHTITMTSMFRWFRELVSPTHSKVEELVHCPWCLGHWVTFIILLTAPGVPRIVVSNSEFYNFMLTAFTIVGMAGLILYVILRAFDPVAKAGAQRKLEKLNKDHKPK